MRRTFKIAVVLLCVVMTFNILSIVQHCDVSADAKTYNHKYGNYYYGEYYLYESDKDVAAVIKSNLISRVSQFTFYIKKNNVSDKGKYLEGLVSTAVKHDQSNPAAGDFLAKSFDSYSYSYTFFSKGYKKSDLYLVTYTFNYYTTASEESKLTNDLTKLKNSLIKSGMSDYEKVKAIYGWIVNNVSYDYTNSNKPASSKDPKTYTAYNAYYKKTAVCQGVAGLFYRLLLSAGVDNRIVYCGNHCWNIVKVDGKYYNCDATWELGHTTYKYFLCGNTESFRSIHGIKNNNLYMGYSIPSTDYTNSDILTRAFVGRLYTVVLGRDAELSGLDYWTAELLAKRCDGASLALSFFNSNEFKARSLTDEEYLTILYSAFFNRSIDGEGKAFWLSQMSNGTTRQSVLNSFVNSKEWDDICKSYGINSGANLNYNNTNNSASDPVRQFAERLYTKILNRPADADGLNYWTQELKAKRVSGTSAAYSFVFSAEFKNSGVDDSEFVKRLYRLFMNREYDQGGYDYWMSLLSSGKTREEIFYGFAGSQEFANICKAAGISV